MSDQFDQLHTAATQSDTVPCHSAAGVVILLPKMGWKVTHIDGTDVSATKRFGQAKVVVTARDYGPTAFISMFVMMPTKLSRQFTCAKDMWDAWDKAVTNKTFSWKMYGNGSGCPSAEQVAAEAEHKAVLELAKFFDVARTVKDVSHFRWAGVTGQPAINRWNKDVRTALIDILARQVDRAERQSDLGTGYDRSVKQVDLVDDIITNRGLTPDGMSREETTTYVAKVIAKMFRGGEISRLTSGRSGVCWELAGQA